MFEIVKYTYSMKGQTDVFLCCDEGTGFPTRESAFEHMQRHDEEWGRENQRRIQNWEENLPKMRMETVRHGVERYCEIYMGVCLEHVAPCFGHRKQYGEENVAPSRRSSGANTGHLYIVEL